MLLITACGSHGGQNGHHSSSAATDTTAATRADTKSSPGSIVILGCGRYCQTVNAARASAEGPTQDVHPPYAAGWSVPKNWGPLSSGVAAITITCNAGISCRGALILDSYSVTDCTSGQPCPAKAEFGRSDLLVPAHGTRTIGIRLSGAAAVHRVTKLLADWRNIHGFPPDLAVRVIIDAGQSRDSLPPTEQRYLVWVYAVGRT